MGGRQSSARVSSYAVLCSGTPPPTQAEFVPVAELAPARESGRAMSMARSDDADDPQSEAASAAAPQPPASWTHDEGSKLCQAPRATALPDDRARELWELLFGGSPEPHDVQRWTDTAFDFVGADEAAGPDTPACAWGLRQTLGGPCGVLAAAQAFVVRQLLWGAAHELAPRKALRRSPSATSTASTTIGTDSETDTPGGSCGSSVVEDSSPRDAPEAGCGGVAALVDRLQGRFGSLDSCAVLAAALVRILRNAAPPSGPFVWAEVTGRSQVRAREFDTSEALAAWLVGEGLLQAMRSPVLSFVCSLVLTRGVEAVKSDMDCAESSLIGLYGHCSQELTNLCITGQAATNVFDGSVVFEDGDDALRLRGAQASPEVGFLSAHEPLMLAEVGRLMKRPRYPLWVVGSSTHYTLLLAGSCLANHAAAPAPADQEPAEGEEPCCGACSSAWGARAPCAERPVALLHFNGLAVAGKCPTLAAVELRPSGSASEPYAPGSLPDGEEDSNMFAEVLRTRWPKAEVSYPTASGTSGGTPRIK